MNESPKVTAVIPVYNREKYVSAVIDSLLSQTFPDFELLVIDDGSTKSREVVRSYHDPRIRLMCNETNEGIPKTRNKGIQFARGEYLAFLDSDDWPYPERLAKQGAFLDSHPDYAAVGAWIVWMDEEGRSLRRVKRKPVLPDEIAAQRLFHICNGQRPGYWGCGRRISARCAIPSPHSRKCWADCGLKCVGMRRLVLGGRRGGIFGSHRCAKTCGQDCVRSFP